MSDFVWYVLLIGRHAVALTLTILGLLGELSRVLFDGFPIPRWVDLMLLASGTIWGGYVVYRDKAPPEPLAPTGPTPQSVFYSRLSTLPRHMPMGEMVIGFDTRQNLRFTEEEFDAIDAWMESLNRESVPSRTDRSFIRRQHESGHVLLWHCQADPPGPVVSIDKSIEVHPTGKGTAADLDELYSFSTLVCERVRQLSTILGGQPARIAFALQPYPSEHGPIIDLWFGDLPAPDPTGAAGNVPPWQEILDPCDNDAVAQLPAMAARSLLRHYGYRNTAQTIEALIHQG
jgi:hypothetical protein